MTGFAVECANGAVKSKSRSKDKDLLPSGPLLQEFATLRAMFRKLLASYTREIETEIAQFITLVKAEGEAAEPNRERAHDFRDMLVLLRSLDIKPDKGRRRDLKRVEALLAELREIVKRW